MKEHLMTMGDLELPKDKEGFEKRHRELNEFVLENVSPSPKYRGAKGMFISVTTGYGYIWKEGECQNKN